MRTLQGKTLFITGGSRGIGLAIPRRAATDGGVRSRFEVGGEMDIALSQQSNHYIQCKNQASIQKLHD